MMNVRRQDLGADIVVLPQRNLVVLHPDLSYSQALGAVMAAIPDLHIDVATRLVEKVTPRPVREPRRWPGICLRMTLAAVAAILGWTAFPSPAVAGPEFGPNWSAAVAYLGLDCTGSDPNMRICTDESGRTFPMRGYRHDTGTLYVSEGPKGRVIFVFDNALQAVYYAGLHPDATLHGRAVVW